MSKIIVGVSVTPDLGLEVAQIDFNSRTVQKYGVNKQVVYDPNRREIADLDIFREALGDLLAELAIPKGTELVLNIPSVVFKVEDFLSSLNSAQIMNAIEDNLSEHYLLKDYDCAIAASAVPSPSNQHHRIVYTAVQKSMLIEIALMVKEFGYKLHAIDTSINSVLNALIYKERVSVNSGESWILAIVDNSTCRVMLMNGNYYVDCIEERISIGEVLDDSENYSAVIGSLQSIIKDIPAKYLCVVSKTDVISAEILASKLKYSAPIIYQEANRHCKEEIMRVSGAVDPEVAYNISLDVIGAAIYKDFARYSSTNMNLYNETLGDIYASEQPATYPILGTLTPAKFAFWLIVLAILAAVAIGIPWGILQTKINSQQATIASLESDIARIKRELQDNEAVSANLFDEGYEIALGLINNKNVYSYYTIVGTEIPKKLWLTHLTLGDKVVIEGQADNLESVYGFFRNIKDYNPESGVKLQKLGLASSQLQAITDYDDLTSDLALTSLNADFYEFRISDSIEDDKPEEKSKKGKKSSSKKSKSAPKAQIK